MHLWTKDLPKLKTLLPMTNGIFAHMQYTFRLEVGKPQLDMMLKTNYGERNPSPVVDYVTGFAESDDKPHWVWRQLTDQQLTKLAELILAMYKPKWDKLGRVYDIQYDPIHNYLDEWEDHSDGESEDTTTNDLTRRDTLESSVSRSNTRTDNLNDATTGTVQKANTRTDNLLETTSSEETHQDSTSGADNIYGFNSASAVGDTTNSGTSGGSVEADGTKANTGTQAESGTDTYNTNLAHSGTRSDSGTESTTGENTRETTGTVTEAGTNSRDRDGKHFGNIGNLTSQKQILEEIELWKWNYMQTILEDVRDFISLPTYL